MAEWKMVDAEQLDADLKSVADAIRDRSGTTEPMAFPDGMVSAVEGIPDYLGQYLTGKIVEYTNPEVIYGKGYGFMQASIVTINYPNAIQTGYWEFRECKSLENVNMPKLTTVSSGSFATCSKLKLFDGKCVESITGEAFAASGLVTLILRKTDAICNLTNANAFAYCPIEWESNGGYIYVPRALLDSYKTATNWSNFVAHFRALEDYTVDGTATGAFDTTKI